VYDVTEFLSIHPGGAGVLAGLGGKDATDFFDELHKPEILESIGSEYKIGVIGEAPADAAGGGASEGQMASEGILAAERWREVEAPTSSGNNEVMSPADVATHNHPDDCWIVIDGKVYDVTKFMEDHPGGPKPLALYAGKDASEEFTMVHHPDIIKAYGELYRVGVLEGSEAAAVALAEAAEAPAPAAAAAAPVDGAPAAGYYSADDVAQHSSKDDCWIIVRDGTPRFAAAHLLPARSTLSDARSGRRCVRRHRVPQHPPRRRWRYDVRCRKRCD